MLQRSRKPNPAKTQTELYFEQLIPASEALAEYQWHLKQADMRAYGLTSPSGRTDTKVQVSAEPDAAFVRKLEKRDDLSRRLAARIRLLQSLINQATGLIDQYTSGREQKILQLRYLQGLEWLAVSKEVDNLSPKQLRRVARNGLEKIVLPDDAIWIRRRGMAA